VFYRIRKTLQEIPGGNAARVVSVEKIGIVADMTIMWYTHPSPTTRFRAIRRHMLEVFPRPMDNEIRAGKEAFV